MRVNAIVNHLIHLTMFVTQKSNLGVLIARVGTSVGVL